MPAEGMIGPGRAAAPRPTIALIGVMFFSIAVMGICNKSAGILAPIAFGLLVLRVAAPGFANTMLARRAMAEDQQDR